MKISVTCLFSIDKIHSSDGSIELASSILIFNVDDWMLLVIFSARGTGQFEQMRVLTKITCD